MILSEGGPSGAGTGASRKPRLITGGVAEADHLLSPSPSMGKSRFVREAREAYRGFVREAREAYRGFVREAREAYRVEFVRKPERPTV